MQQILHTYIPMWQHTISSACYTLYLQYAAYSKYSAYKSTIHVIRNCPRVPIIYIVHSTHHTHLDTYIHTRTLTHMHTHTCIYTHTRTYAHNALCRRVGGPLHVWCSMYCIFSALYSSRRISVWLNIFGGYLPDSSHPLPARLYLGSTSLSRFESTSLCMQMTQPNCQIPTATATRQRW